MCVCVCPEVGGIQYVGCVHTIPTNNSMATCAHSVTSVNSSDHIQLQQYSPSDLFPEVTL